jgi:hypothetical protein
MRQSESKAWHPRMDALMDEVREREREERAVAKLAVRSWARRQSRTFYSDVFWEVNSDGSSVSVGNECLVARIPETLMTVLNARKFHPGPARRIRDFIAEDLRDREIPVVSVVPPYPMSTHDGEDLRRAWEVHVERSAPNYADRIRRSARQIVDIWLDDEDGHLFYGWVEYSSFAGKISVQFDCIVTRAEPRTIALVSAKKFPQGRETQIFRDAVREYLQELKVPVRDVAVKTEGRYVTEGDLIKKWFRDRPRLIAR